MLPLLPLAAAVMGENLRTMLRLLQMASNVAFIQNGHFPCVINNPILLTVKAEPCSCRPEMI